MFRKEFLRALSNWQRGWLENQDERRVIADNLVMECEHLPKEFKEFDDYCYRKRFIIGPEIVPILLEDNFFEGIASWSIDLDFTKSFKGLVKRDTTFSMLFKHKPEKDEIIINLCKLWENHDFKLSVEQYAEEEPENAYPLQNFQDFQGEIILRSSLKGSEIEHIVGISSSFDDICNMANIPENEREKLSKQYANDPNGIPILIPTYASTTGTKEALKNTIEYVKNIITNAKANNIPVLNLQFESHEEDFKHKK